VKFEVRCGACGKGYLVDETKIPVDGGFIPCQACGTTIPLTPRAAAPAGPPAPLKLAPAERRAPRPAAPVPPQAVAAASDVRGEVCCPRCGLHFEPDARAERATSTRPVVLLVEDMDYFVEIARDALAGRYELKIAHTVDEARQLLVRGGIDLLLLDLTLEDGQDGLRLLKEPPGKVCPVLLFTAQDESEMYGDGWNRMLALGIDDVVIKGMNMGEILARKVSAMLGEPQPKDTYQR
jgi:predicted Zn finger-like uncharacterized protein